MCRTREKEKEKVIRFNAVSCMLYALYGLFCSASGQLSVIFERPKPGGGKSFSAPAGIGDIRGIEMCLRQKDEWPSYSHIVYVCHFSLSRKITFKLTFIPIFI